MSKALAKRFFGYAALVCLGILIGVQLMGAAAAATPSHEPVQPQDTGPTSDSRAPNAWHTCTIDNVVTWTERVHVKCTTAADSTIWYFATPNSDYKHAARILSQLLTAQATTNQVSVEYDPADTTTGPTYGCFASNCRPILALSIDSP